MQNIRNFAIIAHVDHGKSTLADRMLELTHTVSSREMKTQLLDSNPIERERGITIKLAPVRMSYTLNNQTFILNLIDTPGHVDFSYEVNRSLAACEGAILLVDATQGIQAQTLAHYHQAKKLNLTIIPVVNKIDVTTADIEGARQQLHDILDFELDSILMVSGKTGAGVPQLLQAVIDRIPPPRSSSPVSSPTRALVFNSNYDPHLGVIAWVRLFDGEIQVNDEILLLGTGASASALEVGIFSPSRKQVNQLSTGEVGYVVTNLKDISHLRVGDTLTTTNDQRITNNLPVPLPGYQLVKPVVFVSFYPTDGADINLLRDSLGKLRLQDSSLDYSPEFSPALGNGFRVGLLGLLHADIVQERLEREFGLELIAAAPSVAYEVLLVSGQVLNISKAMDLPDPSLVREIREPIIRLTLFVPRDYLGPVIRLCQEHRGVLHDMQYLGQIVTLIYSLPLSEMIRQFYDRLKSASAGFATLDYELEGFRAADLVKLDILVAGNKVDALSQIIPRTQSAGLARDLIERLKSLIPRAQFEIPLQAAVGGHILARADIKAFRKDVTAKLYGGDQTRKDKLLKKQQKGKSRMKRVGRVDIPQEAFLSILKI
ncbi:MAG: Elongation factor 4 [Candidatus Amesbacteria bacterium GW2011_GWA1_47_16]|uniref:Elongation factor 4 n=3 Tax=Candidatus Amesiibacteriota TaxID=1752730 RepID=A0A0G1S6Q8_9BACT|nr:MAG: Elongation factor 4 [Candidatus Amesbacteria bacterium GW2011_GWA1_47_16]KKU65066.1 MAG: Elongation factor 4 [Candidatus Amesbacteria bacterium GW2011_GWC1_47_15]KKU97305.1 MAG: Elongation factor 4 [Candidatus Amesbacteria bacterium GW2011_GWB1_48_13]